MPKRVRHMPPPPMSNCLQHLATSRQYSSANSSTSLLPQAPPQRTAAEARKASLLRMVAPWGKADLAIIPPRCPPENQPVALLLRLLRQISRRHLEQARGLDELAGGGVDLGGGQLGDLGVQAAPVAHAAPQEQALVELAHHEIVVGDAHLPGLGVALLGL